MKDVLRAIEGVGLYQCISLLVFGLFFITMLLWTFKLRKPQIEHMSALPLQDDNSATSSNGDTHHAG